MTANNKKYIYSYKINSIYDSYLILNIYAKKCRYVKIKCIHCNQELEMSMTAFHNRSKKCKCTEFKFNLNIDEYIKNFENEEVCFLESFGAKYVDKKTQIRVYAKFRHLECGRIFYKSIHFNANTKSYYKRQNITSNCKCKQNKNSNGIGRTSHKLSKDPFYKWFYKLKTYIILDEYWSEFENFANDLYKEYHSLVKYKSTIILLPVDSSKPVGLTNYLLTIKHPKLILKSKLYLKD